MDRTDCQRRDRECRLAGYRERFSLPDGVLYFDGNSLGALPKTTAADINELVEAEWGGSLVKGWLDADWFFLARQAGDAIAPLIGASEGEVIVSDSTSVNIFKLAATLLRHGNDRSRVITEKGNFPTDVYILEGLIDLLDKDHELFHAEPDRLIDAIDDRTGLVLLTHVNYLTGAVHDMKSITERCKRLDVPVIWDLSHSAGAVSLELNRWNVDYAVGCTYKFLNGGPGSPAYIYISRTAIGSYEPVVTGWFGHADQFRFEERYRSAESIDKCLVGTPPIMSLRGIMSGVRCFDGVNMDDLVQKSRRLSELFIELADEKLMDFGLELASPRDSSKRGSQVSFSHPHAYAISKALIARDVIPDFREPEILRFGITPLYMRYVDVWDAVEILEEIMISSTWKAFHTEIKDAVT